MDFNNNSLLGTLRILLIKGDKGDKGEAGISGDYAGLINKPKINNVTLSGNVSGSALGLASQVALETVDNKIDTLQGTLLAVEDVLAYTGSVASAVAGSKAISKTGYTPIGIVGYDCNFGGGMAVACQLVIGTGADSGKIFFNLFKVGGTPTGELHCRVLYLKTS